MNKYLIGLIFKESKNPKTQLHKMLPKLKRSLIFIRTLTTKNFLQDFHDKETKHFLVKDKFPSILRDFGFVSKYQTS